MDLGLKGKTALVTGSTGGTGLAAALGLARDGAHVIINGRTEARLTQAREQILQAVPGAQVSTVAADLSTAAGAEAFLRAFPDVDILVNNLGIFAQFVADLGKSRGMDAQTAERDFFTHARPSSLIQRFLSPEEVANMIVYVCSERASGTNGASLRVEGGLIRAIL